MNLDGEAVLRIRYNRGDFSPSDYFRIFSSLDQLFRNSGTREQLQGVSSLAFVEARNGSFIVDCIGVATNLIDLYTKRAVFADFVTYLRDIFERIAPPTLSRDPNERRLPAEDIQALSAIAAPLVIHRADTVEIFVVGQNDRFEISTRNVKRSFVLNHGTFDARKGLRGANMERELKVVGYAVFDGKSWYLAPHLKSPGTLLSFDRIPLPKLLEGKIYRAKGHFVDGGERGDFLVSKIERYRKSE